MTVTDTKLTSTMTRGPAESRPTFLQDITAGVLAEITTPFIQLAVWQRRLIPSVMDDVRQIIEASHWQDLRVSLPTKNLDEAFDKAWPAYHLYPSLRTDISLLSNMLACLFDADWIGIRLTRLDRAMCPRFHTDQVPCRLITTYAGQGTEWLPYNVKNRALADQTPKPDFLRYAQPEDIRQVAAGDVALFKGNQWPGQEGAGVVHRSPHLNADERRLVLTIDFA